MQSDKYSSGYSIGSDPIIEKILSERNILDDELSPVDELERRHRMYTMLKSSKKYRKLATQQANETWASQPFEILDINDQCPILSKDSSRRSHVSFSDNIEIIPSDTDPTLLQSVVGGIKNIFKRKNKL